MQKWLIVKIYFASFTTMSRKDSVDAFDMLQ